ncbi:hypothetical protein DYB37_008594 [Aphanomyces astaci]|uniref:Uncharacterized protein n=1 Tax=Aphanomyces astaci TaxID=112090 RepID=A0A3R6XK16_APHAT|nr:hypothetical protein DYB37_008594 [Aphanomyces astaci]
MAAFASAGKSMPGAHVSFDDLLEREWSANQPHAHTSSDGRKQVPKKPFLKRGARGWWKNSDKAVPMAYSLSSAHDDEQKGTATSKTTAFPSKQQRPSQASSQLRRTQLFELETEVKHYKQETLKLQKRREALEADQRKLDQLRHDWHEEKRKAQEDMDAQWKNLRKERRALDQALKFGAAALPDRKERGEIDALKAQLVKMQVRTI